MDSDVGNRAKVFAVVELSSGELHNPRIVYSEGVNSIMNTLVDAAASEWGYGHHVLWTSLSSCPFACPSCCS